MHVPLTWRSGLANSAPNAGLHEVFARIAALHPGRIAIRSSGTSLTYAELDARASACADALQRRGVEPGTVVAILLSRSIDLVVSLLAVLKCGAAYSAPDPTWPSGRVAEALATMGASHVISSAGASPHATLFIEDIPAAAGTGFRPVHTDGAEPAAVLFTSRCSILPPIL